MDNKLTLYFLVKIMLKVVHILAQIGDEFEGIIQRIEPITPRNCYECWLRYSVTH